MPTLDFALLGLDVQDLGDGTFSGRNLGVWHVKGGGVGVVTFVARVSWHNDESGDPHTVVIAADDVVTGVSEILQEDVLIAQTALSSVFHQMEVDGSRKTHRVVSLRVDDVVLGSVHLWTG